MGGFSAAARQAGRSIRSRMLAGVAFIVPFLVTVWVIRFVFDFLDGWIRPLQMKHLGRHIPGTGLLATALLVYLLGLLVANVAGRTLVRWTEKLIQYLPVIGDVYGSSKQILQSLAQPAGKAYKRVVLFEFPRPGVYALGFVTREVHRPGAQPIYAVFMPTTPNPTSGYMLLIPAEQARETSLSVEEAVKMVVSGGLVMPPRFPPEDLETLEETAVPPSGK